MRSTSRGPFRDLDWQPSDPDPDARDFDRRLARGGRAARTCCGRSSSTPPRPTGRSPRADAVLCINMVHISPVAATEGLVAGAARLLAPGAPLILYGPYLDAEVETAPSNLAFDADLRARNPEWGLRTRRMARRAGRARAASARTRRVAMPANNLTLVYRRTET